MTDIKRSYLCDCNLTKQPIEQTLEEIEVLPLRNGGHTSAMPMICGVCHRMDFMPRDNWELFIEQGDPDTVAEWEKGFQDFINKRHPIAVPFQVAKAKTKSALSEVIEWLKNLTRKSE